MLHRLRRQFRQPHTAGNALVGHQYARTTRHGDHRDTIALGQFAAAEHATVIHHVLYVVNLNDARLLERGLVKRHRTAQVGGVGRRRLLSLVGIADFPHQYRFAGVHSLHADAEQTMRVFHAFDIANNHAGLRIAYEVIDKVERRDADFIAGGHHLPECKPAIKRGQRQHREPEASRLRHHAHATRWKLLREKNRAKARPYFVGHVHHALAVGADDADVVLARNVGQAFLKRHAFAACFGKTRSENNYIGHALFTALLQNIRHARGVDQNNGEIGRLRKVGYRGVTLVSKDFRITRIDGIQLAAVTVIQQMAQWLAADGDEVLGCADEGDGFRAEKSFEV